MLTEQNIINAYAFCKDDISLIENYDIAISDDKRYVCHHKNGINISAKELKSKGLYFHRPSEELIFLEIGEHSKLHIHNLRVETRQKMSDNHADFKGENNPMYGKPSAFKGKHHTDETRQKMSDSHKGENHPLAKRCIINGKTYCCLKDAYKDIKPNYTYNTFCIKYKKQLY